LVVVAALHVDAVSASLKFAYIARRVIDVDLQRPPPDACVGMTVSPIVLLAEAAPASQPAR
jgi:hypothetical protein